MDKNRNVEFKILTPEEIGKLTNVEKAKYRNALEEFRLSERLKKEERNTKFANEKRLNAELRRQQKEIDSLDKRLFQERKRKLQEEKQKKEKELIINSTFVSKANKDILIKDSKAKVTEIRGTYEEELEFSKKVAEIKMNAMKKLLEADSIKNKLIREETIRIIKDQTKKLVTRAEQEHIEGLKNRVRDIEDIALRVSKGEKDLIRRNKDNKTKATKDAISSEKFAVNLQKELLKTTVEDKHEFTDEFKIIKDKARQVKINDILDIYDGEISSLPKKEYKAIEKANKITEKEESERIRKETKETLVKMRQEQLEQEKIEREQTREIVRVAKLDAKEQKIQIKLEAKEAQREYKIEATRELAIKKSNLKQLRENEKEQIRKQKFEENERIYQEKLEAKKQKEQEKIDAKVKELIRQEVNYQNFVTEELAIIAEKDLADQKKKAEWIAKHPTKFKAQQHKEFVESQRKKKDELLKIKRKEAISANQLEKEIRGIQKDEIKFLENPDMVGKTFEKEKILTDKQFMLKLMREDLSNVESKLVRSQMIEDGLKKALESGDELSFDPIEFKRIVDEKGLKEATLWLRGGDDINETPTELLDRIQMWGETNFLNIVDNPPRGELILQRDPEYGIAKIEDIENFNMANSGRYVKRFKFLQEVEMRNFRMGATKDEIKSLQKVQLLESKLFSQGKLVNIAVGRNTPIQLGTPYIKIKRIYLGKAYELTGEIKEVIRIRNQKLFEEGLRKTIDQEKEIAKAKDAFAKEQSKIILKERKQRELKIKELEKEELKKKEQVQNIDLKKSQSQKDKEIAKREKDKNKEIERIEAVKARKERQTEREQEIAAKKQQKEQEKQFKKENPITLQDRIDSTREIIVQVKKERTLAKEKRLLEKQGIQRVELPEDIRKADRNASIKPTELFGELTTNKVKFSSRSEKDRFNKKINSSKAILSEVNPVTKKSILASREKKQRKNDINWAYKDQIKQAKIDHEKKTLQELLAERKASKEKQKEEKRKEKLRIEKGIDKPKVRINKK